MYMYVCIYIFVRRKCVVLAIGGSIVLTHSLLLLVYYDYNHQPPSWKSHFNPPTQNPKVQGLIKGYCITPINPY